MGIAASGVDCALLGNGVVCGVGQQTTVSGDTRQDEERSIEGCRQSLGKIKKSWKWESEGEWKYKLSC